RWAPSPRPPPAAPCRCPPSCPRLPCPRPRLLPARSGSEVRPLVAVAQVTSTPDKEQNWSVCSALVREAAQHGAGLIFLPEGFDFIGLNPEQTLGMAEALDGPLLRRYMELARDLGVWLSLGGFHERGQDWESTQRIYNCHVVLDSMGHLVAAYRKTHLCDVELEGRVSMKESSFTNPGTEIVAPVSTPAGKVWHRPAPTSPPMSHPPRPRQVLLRARAIENQCYVVAAAQTGKNHEHRTSYGHSLVVDPWGAVVAQCREGPGLCYAEIDLEYLHRIRREIPVQSHRRHDLYGTVGLVP
uniref:Uncharacterized protein n=1 Tax=Melopsittacus undulatus TaxID=13146 RepID=A0A8V5H570_MELUD